MVCWKCGTSEGLPVKPSRLETCPSCNSFLHSCRNCKFYDPGAYNHCAEPQAERVVEKENANFCGYFAVIKKNVSSKNNQRKVLSKKEAEKQWEALFKKK